jgi:tetratricopeptide (TPR) repeat protein
MEALELVKRDHMPRATDLWEQAYSKYPNEAVESDLTVNLLMSLKRYDQLEELLSQGLRRHPNDSRFTDALTTLAFEREDFDTAFERANRLRKIAPLNEKGYRIASAILSSRGQFDEAERLLKSALGLLSNNPSVLIEHAKLAERQGNWDEALSRWNYLYSACNHLAAIQGAALVLGKLNRFDEAETLIESVRYRAGSETNVWIAYARLAEFRNDWQEAAKRWARFRKSFPMNAFGYLQSLRPLRHLNRIEELIVVLRAGIPFVRYEPKILTEYAKAASQYEAWPEAVELWKVVRELFPDRDDGYEAGAEALLILGRQEEASVLIEEFQRLRRASHRNPI